MLRSLLFSFLWLAAFRPAFAQLTPPAWGPAQALTSPGAVGFLGQVLDAQGNTYVAGMFSNTVALATGTVLTSRGSADGFVAKYSPAGGLVWALQVGGPNYDRPAGLAIDAAGMLYLVGNFAGSVQAGSQSVSFTSTAPHFYLATITPQGLVSSLRQDGQPTVATNTGADANAAGIGVDAAGNVYVAGDLTGGPLSIGGIALTVSANGGPRDYFMVKYSAGTGTAQWARQGGRVAYVSGQGFYIPTLVVSPAGEAYLVGTFAASMGAFGALPLPAELGSFDIGVVKYNTQGTEQWVRRSGGAGLDRASHASLDASGHLLVAGAFSGSASFGGQALVGTGTNSGGLFLYSALTGAEQWSRVLTGSTTAYYSDVVVDGVGNFYVAGAFDGTGTAGGAPLTSAGGTDVVVTSYTPQGAFRWQQQSDGTTDETASSIRLDNAQRLHVGGSFIGAAQFGPAVLTGQSTTAASVLLAQLTALPLAARAAQATVPMSLYPNPAHGSAALPSLPAGTQVVVADAMGRPVRPAAPAMGSLTLAGLAPGFYHVLASAPDGRHWTSALLVE